MFPAIRAGHFGALAVNESITMTINPKTQIAQMTSPGCQNDPRESPW